jgi:hypothetical protein
MNVHGHSKPKTLNVNVWTTFGVLVYLAILGILLNHNLDYFFLGEAIMAAFIVKEM